MSDAEPLSIDILFPTRKRPDNVERLLCSVRDTCIKPDRIQVICFLDNDDKESIERVPDWKALVDEEGGFDRQFLQGKVSTLADAYNKMLRYSRADILMYAADDIVFHTAGWDDQVRHVFGQFPDRIVLVWGRDKARGTEQFPDHGFISRWSCNLLRCFFPVFPPDPSIGQARAQAFTDIWLKRVYELLDRWVLMTDVEIEHKHWMAGAELDEAYLYSGVFQNSHINQSFEACVQKYIPEHVDRLSRFIAYCKENPDTIPSGTLDIEETQGVHP